MILYCWIYRHRSGKLKRKIEENCFHKIELFCCKWHGFLHNESASTNGYFKMQILFVLGKSKHIKINFSVCFNNEV